MTFKLILVYHKSLSVHLNPISKEIKDHLSVLKESILVSSLFYVLANTHTKVFKKKKKKMLTVVRYKTLHVSTEITFKLILVYHKCLSVHLNPILKTTYVIINLLDILIKLLS